MTSYLQNWKSYQTEHLCQECFYAFMVIMTHAKFHFNPVDVNLDFWHLSLCPSLPPPPQAWRATEKAGPDRVNFKAGL